MKIKPLLYKITFPFFTLYWKFFKPKTFGVKVLIIHPEDNQKILLIRHSYGNTLLWNIPGGGYNPKKETAETAAKRELYEELKINNVNLQFLSVYKTNNEGKDDTVTIFKGILENKEMENLKPNSEIAEIKWKSINALNDKDNLAKITKYAIAKAFLR